MFPFFYLPENYLNSFQIKQAANPFCPKNVVPLEIKKIKLIIFKQEVLWHLVYQNFHMQIMHWNQ